MKFHLLIAIPVVLLLFASGCDLSSGKDAAPEQSFEMKAAQAAERLGDTDKALSHYFEVTALYPHYALPYLQVAIILHEKKKDYIGAIYNYEQYIRFAEHERDGRNIAIVSNRMEKARQLLTAQCAKTISAGSASPDVAVMSSIADLNAKVSELENQKKTLQSSNEVLRTQIIALNNRITRQSLLINEMKNTSDGSTRRSGNLSGIVQYKTLSNEDGSTTSVQTYEVKAGDTLSRIAEIAYGDASKWPRIKKANPDKIKDDRVRPGDVLIIPE